MKVHLLVLLSLAIFVAPAKAEVDPVLVGAWRHTCINLPDNIDEDGRPYSWIDEMVITAAGSFYAQETEFQGLDCPAGRERLISQHFATLTASNGKLQAFPLPPITGFPETSFRHASAK